MLPDHEEESKLKEFLLAGGTTTTTTQNNRIASLDDPANFLMATTSDSSTVWTTIPPAPSTNEKDATPAEIVAISEAYGQSSSTTSLTSSSSLASQYQYNSYPSSAQYAMYTSATPATAYYQQMASNLRAQTTAAAAFPYSLAGTSSYYTGSYPVDYTAAAYPSPYYTNIRGGAPYYNPLNAAAYASVANSVLGSDAVNLGGTTSSDASTPATSSSIGGSGGGGLVVPFQNLKEKKQKAKKKKTGSCSPGDETYARVFIWDLDEIAVLTRNYLQQLTMGFPGYANASSSLQHLTEVIALSSFSDLSEVMEGDVTNIEDAVVDETSLETGGPMDNLRGLDVMRRVAPKYASFRQFYTELSRKMHSDFKQEGVLNYELLKALGLAAREVELSQATCQLQGIQDTAQRWQSASRCMELVQKRSDESREEKYANVILSGDGVVLGAAQLMIAGLSPSVPIENIYSVTKNQKEAIFEKIQTRFGKKCSFVCVCGADTAPIAKRLSIPVWPIGSFNDLDKLFNAQTNYLLG